MDVFIQGIGKIISSLVRENIHVMMEQNILVISKMEKNMDKVQIII